MSQTSDNKAIYIGVALIVLVGAVTFARPYLRKDVSSNISAPIKVEDQEQFSYITPSELEEKIKKNDKLRLIDARPVEDFKREHLFGSASADQDTVNFYLEGIPQDQLIVIIGIDPNDFSAKLLFNTLREKGYSNVSLLAGGISAWIADHGRTIRQGNPDSLADQAKISTVAPEELKKSLDGGSRPFILDLRSAESYSDGHLPGARNIPAAELEVRFGEISRGREVIYYSQTELESFQTGVTLFDLGIFNARALEGGISAWREKDYPVEK